MRLEEGRAGLAALGFAGANVTIPHKTAAVAFCDELDPFAERAGSVNTIVVRDGRLHGSSTDGDAVLIGDLAAGADVLLLGAGGAAQAVASGAGRPRRSDGHRRRTPAGCGPRPRRSPSHRLPRGRRPLGGRLAASGRRGDRRQRHAGTGRAARRGGARAGDRRPRVSPGRRGDGAFVGAAIAAGREVVLDGLEVLVRQGAASFERGPAVRRRST